MFPATTPVDSPSQTAFAPFDIAVPFAGRAEMEPCLAVNLDPVACGPAEKYFVGDSIRTSCGNAVKRLTYSLDGGTETTVCEACEKTRASDSPSRCRRRNASTTRSESPPTKTRARRRGPDSISTSTELARRSFALRTSR